MLVGLDWEVAASGICPRTQVAARRAAVRKRKQSIHRPQFFVAALPDQDRNQRVLPVVRTPPSTNRATSVDPLYWAH